MGKYDYDDRRSRKSPERRRKRSRSRSPYAERSSRDHYSSRRRSRSRERRNRSPKGECPNQNLPRSNGANKFRTNFEQIQSNLEPIQSNHLLTISHTDLIPVDDFVSGDLNLASLDKEEQQKKLESVVQLRREKVAKWRVEREKKNELLFEQPALDDEAKKEEAKKKWSLEDDSDENGSEEFNIEHDSIEVDDSKLMLPRKPREDENEFTKKVFEVNLKSNGSRLKFGNKLADHSETLGQTTPKKPKKPIVENDEEEKQPAKEESDDDVDPLDLFMEGIENEMKKTRGNVIKKKEKVLNDKKISIITGVAKKKQPAESSAQVKKGELLEQNQDALEYSSEDDANAADDLQTMNNNLMSINKTKKLTSISKDDITFMPFEKCFYVEVAELAQMTPEQVEELREELEGIKVKGKGCPKPIKTWAHSGVSKKVFDALKRYGYEKPTPIQAQAIPAIMSGRDIIGIAKTGSGKTLAFLLPMFRHILAQPPLEPGDGPIAIIMTPTRELATQITSECRKFTKYIGLKVVAVYGGTPISEQIGELKPGAEIVVCTPGRMIDMLAVNSGRVTNLRRCTYLVLDEADRMFDMGFEPQVTRIIDGIRPDRQTVVFSATFPRVMETLARRILNKPIEVAVGGKSIVCKDIEQTVVIIEEDDKFRRLLKELGDHLGDGRSAIVFVDKQENADFLLKELMHASYSCLALHGGIDQTDRDSTIADFKANKVRVLVATSVAARGLDIKHCILVVNYDCPNHYEDYVHRCGRTGRAGNKGYAVTFITPDQGKFAYDINKALELSGKPTDQGLVRLFEEYKKKQEEMGRTVKAGGSGFSGKGFKFNEQEAQSVNEKRKFQKIALGLQDSDDEDPEEDLNKEIANMLAPKKPKQSGAPQAPTTAAGAQAATATATTAPAVVNQPSMVMHSAMSTNDKIELARKAASLINLNLANKVTSHTEAFLKGETNVIPVTPADSAKSVAERRAELLNARLNYIPKDNDEPDEEPEEPVQESGFKRFETELEINDFPQQARWRVTSKEAIAQIAEYSEAGITVRGTYVPPGKRSFTFSETISSRTNRTNRTNARFSSSIAGGRYNPEAGERKLYLAIEGTSELAVNRAKDEIIALIREELTKLHSSNQHGNKGRYKVV